MKSHHIPFLVESEKMSLIPLLLSAAFAVLLYKGSLQPAFFCPLSRIPNAHFTSSLSKGWISWQRYRRRENTAVHEAHERLGPIVRLGPRELSVNSLEGLKAVYAGDFEKHPFYESFSNYGS